MANKAESCSDSSPGSMKHIAKEKLEHLLLSQLTTRNLDGVQFILSVFDLEISSDILPDLDKTMSNGETFLTLAAMQGDQNSIRELIDCGADVNIVNSNGDTPLTLAAEKGHVEAVIIFVESGANIDQCNRTKSTPLMLAIKNGHLNVAQILIEAKADVNRVNDIGQSAVMIAKKRGYKDIVKLLIEAGAHAKMSEDDYLYCLHFAIENAAMIIITLIVIIFMTIFLSSK